MEGSTILNSVSSKIENLQETINLPDLHMIPYPIASSSPEQDNISLWYERNVRRLEQRFNMMNEKLNFYQHNMTNLLEPVKNLIYYDISDEASRMTSILDLFRVPEAQDSAVPSTSDESGQTNIESRINSQDYSNCLKKNISDKKRKTNRSTSKISCQKIFTTPKTYRNRVATVTPGANMKTPSRILRQPKDGEAVISMRGSPILVARSTFTNQVPQMHIPLKDGRIYSILGEDGLKNEAFPNVDLETLNRIKKLHEFIEEQILRSNSLN